MRLAWPLIAVLILFSCRPEETVLPLTENEADDLAVALTELPSPAEYVLSLYGTDRTVELIDYPGYRGSVEILKYLIPLLHDRGIRDLSLWFVPDDGLVQANALLGASLFFYESAREMVGRVSYLHLYEEYIDLLRYLYDFNLTLSEGEQPMTLISLDEAENGEGTCLILRKELSPDGTNHPIFLESPRFYDEQEYDPLLKARVDQLTSRLDFDRSLFVLPGESELLFSRSPREFAVIFMDMTPEEAICHPADGGINRENALLALRDFPDVKVSHPLISVPLMTWKQRRYLKESL